MDEKLHVYVSSYQTAIVVFLKVQKLREERRDINEVSGLFERYIAFIAGNPAIFDRLGIGVFELRTNHIQIHKQYSH